MVYRLATLLVVMWVDGLAMQMLVRMRARWVDRLARMLVQLKVRE